MKKTLYWEQNHWAGLSHLHKERCQHQGPVLMLKWSLTVWYLFWDGMYYAAGRKTLDCVQWYQHLSNWNSGIQAWCFDFHFSNKMGDSRIFTNVIAVCVM